MQMNLPGSAMGAWSRTAPAGWATGWSFPALVASIIAASTSWVATPPSRKPRVLWGKRASAMAPAREIRGAAPRQIHHAVLAHEAAEARGGAVLGKPDDFHEKPPFLCPI